MNQFGQILLDALVQCLNVVFSFLKLPYQLWVKAAKNLAEARKAHSLNASKIDSPWPMLSFLKRWIFENFFDFVAFISYGIAPIAAIVEFINTCRFGFKEGMTAFVTTLIIFYFIPIIVFVIKDFFTLVIVAPFKKYISWLKKPAQYVDLTIKNKD